MKLLAPAKINLSLDIVGRRPDGYHLLRMVMQSISLYDAVSLTKTGSGPLKVCCNKPDIPCGDENTVMRAARAFWSETGIAAESGLLFQIDKNIPAQSGLGGGSTDAAAALKLLNCWFGVGLSEAQLCRIGLSVGADVPFCLRGGTALAEGIGEKLQPVSLLPHCWIVVCRPTEGCSTGKVYSSFDACGLSPKLYTDGLLQALRSGKIREISRNLGNSFEASCPLRETSKIREKMICCDSLGACMTGSGSAVYGLFDDREKALRCCEKLSEKYPFAALCEPVPSKQQESGGAGCQPQ